MEHGKSQLGRARVSPSVVVALLGLVAGCQSLKSVGECNRVLGTVNATLGHVSELHEQSPTSAVYVQIADQLNELQLALDQMQISNPQLSKAAKQYTRQIQRVGRESRNYALTLGRLERATESGAADEQKQAQQELERIRQRAEKLAESTKGEARRFSDACRPPK